MNINDTIASKKMDSVLKILYYRRCKYDYRKRIY